MTQDESPPSQRWKEVPPAPSFATELRRAGPVALWRGFMVAVAAVLLGQLIPLAVNLNGAGLAIVTQLRLGWLYTVAANAASIRIDGSSESAAEALLGGIVVIRLAALTFTAVLLWMLVRAGAASATAASDAPARRAVVGAIVGLPYAAPLAIVSLFVELRLRTGGGFLPDVTTFSADIEEMLMFPAVLGMVAGALGGLHTTTWWQGRIGQVCATGWRTFWVALTASLIGLLAFAAIQPDGLDAYVRELRSLGVKGGAVTVAHQFVLLPNQAVLILVPAMGACDTLTTGANVFDVLCLDRLPDAQSPVDWLTLTADGSAPPTKDAPGSTRLFLLVPAVAVLAGARRSAAGATSVGRAAVAAAGAAVVFAALVVAATWASTVVQTTIEVRDGVETEVRRVTLGAQPFVAGAFALGWGVVVGVPTACLASLVRRRRSNASAS